MQEILFLPLDATLDGLLKGPTGVRPPPGMKAPAGSKGPPGQQPKLGASGMGGNPPAPKGPSMGGAGPGGGGGKKYDYVKADKPPPGNAGRTPGGYWKVPVGSSAGKQMSPDNADQPPKERLAALSGAKRDPLSGQSVSKVDENVQKIHEETKTDPLASKPESGPAKHAREKKEARATAEQKYKTAEEGIAARNSMKDEDFKYEPKLEGEATGASSQGGAAKDKKTQAFDMYSTDEKSFEGAHPAAHYALADKFRKDGDDKMASFHEKLAAKKTKGFGHAEHAQLADTLNKHGVHKEAAKQHSDLASEMRAKEMKRDPNWERAAEIDDVTKKDPIQGQQAADVGDSSSDPIHGETVENLGKPERASDKTKQALSDHKEAGGKKTKELSDKHAAGEQALTDKHKQKAADMATSHEEKGRKMVEGHAARETELTERHKNREKELSTKHEAAGKELAEKHGTEHKQHTQNHRDAQDEHVKAQAHLKTLKGSAKPDQAKIKSAQKDVAAAKELITASKRKLDDHKVKAKAQMVAHKESSAKEMAAHKDRASVIDAHKKKASEEMAAHKAKGKADAAAHKTASEKELSDHKAASKKELDAHHEAHGAQGKELGKQHEAASQADAEQDKKSKIEAKAKEQQDKVAAKEQGKSEAEKAANVRRPPADDQEKLKAQGHADKARKIQDNIQTHLDDPNIDPARRETLQQAHQMLQEHVDGGHVPTPEMEQQMKDLEKTAGEHGKKPAEGAPPDKSGGSSGRQAKGRGIGATMAGAYNQGAAAGNAIGAAAASPYSGALGHATLHYGMKGVASGGHYLLTPPAGKSDSEKATAAVASKRHEPSNEHSGGTSEDTDESTETVSAKKHVAKGLRLYVKAGWHL